MRSLIHNVGPIGEIGAKEGDVVRLVYIGKDYLPVGSTQHLADELRGVVGRGFVHFDNRPPVASADENAYYSLVERHVDNMSEAELGSELLEARAHIRALENKLKATGVADNDGLLFRHKKRGTIYSKIGEGRLQTDVPLSDYAELVAYRDIDDGSIWFRSPAEFNDGRFGEIENNM